MMKLAEPHYILGVPKYLEKNGVDTGSMGARMRPHARCRPVRQKAIRHGRPRARAQRLVFHNIDHDHAAAPSGAQELKNELNAIFFSKYLNMRSSLMQFCQRGAHLSTISYVWFFHNKLIMYYNMQLTQRHDRYRAIFVPLEEFRIGKKNNVQAKTKRRGSYYSVFTQD